MKVLQVVSTFYPSLVLGGGNTVAYMISKELVRRGHDVTVATTNAFDKRRRFGMVRYTMPDGIKVRYLNNIIYVPNKQIFIAPEVVKLFEEDNGGFDVIHLHGYRSFLEIALSFLAKEHKIPYVLQAHGSLPRTIGRQKLKWLYDLLFGYRSLRSASKVIAISHMEAMQYGDMGVTKEKIEIIPNGIDLSEYVSLPPRGLFRSQFGISDRDRIVLFLGRLHRIKGIDILAEAFANVVKKMNDTKLVIVGPDDGYLRELEALVKALGIEDDVLIPGPLYDRNKLAAYVDANVYVLPSRYEAFPMSVLEAIACGTPIILTKNCGVAEYFDDKVGLVVEPNPYEIEEALLKMLRDEELDRRFRGNCRAVINELSVSKTVFKLEAVYRDLAGSN